MEIIGYARVSTREQNLDLQLDALKEAGCKLIFEEKVSGVKDIPELDKALAYLREGDTFVIWKLDRLGRSLKDLVYIVDCLQKRKFAFKSIVEFGVPMNEMRNYLNQNSDKQQSYHPGIPLDTIPTKNQELIDWVFEAKEVNPDIFLAIKGDQKSEYKEFKTLIQQLQEKNMNKFQLITSQE